MENVHERYIDLGGEYLFLRHTEIRFDRPTLLFVHGLGDSGLCFAEAFSSGMLSTYNLLVPDGIGYGRSSRASGGDYSFAAQVRRLAEMVSVLGVGEVTLIGHSLGGILGTLWASTDKGRMVRRLVNVEGNLTAPDATFSRRAAAAFEDLRQDFNRWRAWFLSDFAHHHVLDVMGVRPSLKRYYGSLLFARPRAFLENALEIMKRSRTEREDKVSEIGRMYKSLEIPRVYFWGEESLSQETRGFLERERLMNRGFQGAGHWPMIDASEEFYPALAEFLRSTEGGARSSQSPGR
jgi:pimeloyl-ACP methyl ester carboxylesterase